MPTSSSVPSAVGASSQQPPYTDGGIITNQVYALEKEAGRLRTANAKLKEELDTAKRAERAAEDTVTALRRQITQLDQELATLKRRTQRTRAAPAGSISKSERQRFTEAADAVVSAFDRVNSAVCGHMEECGIDSTIEDAFGPLTTAVDKLLRPFDDD